MGIFSLCPQGRHHTVEGCRDSRTAGCFARIEKKKTQISKKEKILPPTVPFRDKRKGKIEFFHLGFYISCGRGESEPLLPRWAGPCGHSPVWGRSDHLWSSNSKATDVQYSSSPASKLWVLVFAIWRQMKK